LSEDELLFKDECYSINGAVFEVYREMGGGYLKPVYQECLTKEFQLRGIPFVEHPELKLFYKQHPLEQTYEPDFICFGKIIVELKAAREISPTHQAQVLNYLKSTGYRLGLLVNFGAYPKAVIQRLILG
jgi:GxxExxY protein